MAVKSCVWGVRVSSPRLTLVSDGEASQAAALSVLTEEKFNERFKLRFHTCRNRDDPTAEREALRALFPGTRCEATGDVLARDAYRIFISYSRRQVSIENGKYSTPHRLPQG